MEKIVEKGYRDCTVTLDGSECAVEFASPYRVFSAQNMSDSDIVMSIESGRTADDDGVRIIEAGGCGMLAHMRSDINTVYITGTGKVHISAGNEAVLPFKAAAKGGDSPAPEYEYVENPTVTADTYTGIVTSSGNNGYWPNAWMVFDGAVDTGSDRWVGNAGDSSWVQYKFSEAKQLAYIGFNPTAESVGTAYKLSVYGTNDDGATLTELYSTGDSGMVMGSGYTRIDINASEKFTAFRFVVKAAGEIRMYTKELVPEPVVTPNDLLTVAGEGNPVQLDSLQGGVPFAEMVVSGKNLLKYPYVESNKTSHAVVFTDNGDGSITVSGTHNGDDDAAYFGFYPWWVSSTNYGRFFLAKGKTVSYRVIGLPAEYGARMSVKTGNNDTGTIDYYFVNGEDTITYTATQDCYIACGFSGDSTSVGQTVDFTVYPQLELGDTATAYEPPITSGDLTVEVCGKNLLTYPYVEGTKTVNGITFTDNGDGTITANGTAAANCSFYCKFDGKIKLNVGKYYLSGCPKNSANGNIRIEAYKYNDSNVLVFSKKDSGDGVLIEIGDPIEIGLRISIYAGVTADNLIFRPQLEIGTEATGYEMYHGASYTITPDSNPYTIPDDIRQQDGLNNIIVSAGELSVTGSLKNATLKKVWDKLDELTTALIVSNGEI